MNTYPQIPMTVVMTVPWFFTFSIGFPTTFAFCRHMYKYPMCHARLSRSVSIRGQVRKLDSDQHWGAGLGCNLSIWPIEGRLISRHLWDCDRGTSCETKRSHFVCEELIARRGDLEPGDWKHRLRLQNCPKGYLHFCGVFITSRHSNFR
jgi:hypothetical protein